LFQEWSDVTNELPAHVRRDLVRKAQQETLPGVQDSPNQPEEPLKALSRKLLNFLQVDTAQQLDVLVESFEGVSSSELIGALFDLEMSGLVRQLPGKQFIKVW
jgi:DNA processing protein